MSDSSVYILLVDDDEALVGILATQLTEQFGYTTRVVYDGQQAIDLLRPEGPMPAVIISDYAMPEVNGIELLKWVRTERKDIPVIILTGAGGEQVAAEALKSGAYDYLRKEHLDLQRLGVTIQSTLERRRLKAIESLEEQREEQTSLNAVATDVVHSILTVLQPTIMDSLAMLTSGLEHLHTRTSKLPDSDKKACDDLIYQLQKSVTRVDNALKLLLEMYSHVSSHHSHLERLQDLKKSVTHL